MRLGKERLEFDRLGLWLVDQNDPRWMMGTWGIDERGQLRDERGSRLPLTGTAPDAFYEGRLTLVDEAATCLDNEGHPVGHGTSSWRPSGTDTSSWASWPSTTS